MKKTLRIAALIAMTAVVVACEKEPQPEGTTEAIEVQQAPKNHAIILNEGDRNGIASLSYLNLATGTLNNDWFLANNERNLGVLGGDVVVYGSKAYVTVSMSGTLEVIDTATGASQQYNLNNCYPNRLTAHGGKIYITCHNPRSVIRIDTTAPGTKEAECLLGDYNPEGIAALNGRLFVASSYVDDGKGNLTYDNKLYVIDINGFNVISTLTIPTNPQKVLPVDNNHVVVNGWGEWDMNTGATFDHGTAVVDAQTLAVTTSPQLISFMAVRNGMVYGIASTYDQSWTQHIEYLTFNPTTLETSSLPIRLDDNVTNNPYSIAVHPDNGDIYITTDGGTYSNTEGDVYCFSSNGTRRWRNQVGVYPSKIVFY